MRLINYIEHAVSCGYRGLRDVVTGQFVPIFRGAKGGEAPSPPPPTQQELDFQQSQTDINRQLLEISAEEREFNTQFQPFLLEDYGLVRDASGQLIRSEDELARRDKQQQLEGLQLDLAIREEERFTQQIALEDQLLPIQLERQGYVYDPETGEITITEEGQARFDRQAKIQQLSEEQSVRYLEGEGEVSAGLEKEITRGREELNARMLSQLGPGWETSSPGIRAAQEFETGASSLRDAERFGRLTSAETIGLQRQAGRYGSDLYARSLVEPRFPTGGARALSTRSGYTADIGQRGPNLNYPYQASAATLRGAGDFTNQALNYSLGRRQEGLGYARIGQQYSAAAGAETAGYVSAGATAVGMIALAI